MVNLSDNRGLLSGLDEARNDHDPEMDFDRLEMETQIVCLSLRLYMI